MDHGNLHTKKNEREKKRERMVRRYKKVPCDTTTS